MNWEAIGVVAEVIAAITVVLSLIYLASQIGLSTRETQATNRDSVSKSMIDIIMKISADSELSELFARGMVDPDSLSDVETLRFDGVMWSLFESIEAAYTQWKRGVLTDEDWGKWDSTLGTFMAQAGGKSTWVRASGNFGPGFVSHVENVEPNENDSWSDPQHRMKAERRDA